MGNLVKHVTVNTCACRDHCVDKVTFSPKRKIVSTYLLTYMLVSVFFPQLLLTPRSLSIAVHFSIKSFLFHYELL